MSTPLSEVFSEVYEFLKDEKEFVAVETGCSFLFVDRFMQNLSTPNIIKYLVKPFESAGKDVYFYSVDNNVDNLLTCKNELSKMNLNNFVNLVFTDSVNMNKCLPEYLMFNFIWMDSAEDEDNSKRELDTILSRVKKRFVLCVDDYGSENSVKWQIPSNYIKSEATYYKTYNTQTGLIVGYYE